MLEHLEPKTVFQYFEEICAIPHPSYHVDAISDYLMDFAKAHGLWAKQDELKNVIIIKEASKGKEDAAPIMIQGHMDMVAVKDDDCDIDLLKDGLRLAIDGDYIYAKGTSLGGDDGIAIAYGLALLSDDSLQLPRIELVITTQEEVGMEGATGIDISECKSNLLLNIDSEDEGEFSVACAGGVRVNAHFDVASESVDETSQYKQYQIRLNGFTGGHSGVEIIYHRANANKVLGYVLRDLQKELGEQQTFALISMQGGLKDNAIPLSAEATILVKETDEKALKTALDAISKAYLAQYKDTDPDGKIELMQADDFAVESDCQTDAGAKGIKIINPACADELIQFLCETPDGVQAMCKDLEGLVQTSLNLGIMNCDLEKATFAFSLRSSVAEEKQALQNSICNMIKEHNGSYELTGNYPAWEYKEDSKLRELFVDVFKKQYHKEPKVLAIHAGLECGILAAKRPGLDCISFGPDILDIHTTKERLSISSVQRVWTFLLEVIDSL